MAIYRGLIRGFLAGVLLTALVGGGAVYLFFKRVQKELSPESIRQTAESVLSDLAGQDVQVGSAEVGIRDGTLSLSRVRVASQTDTFVNVERIVAYAEDGLSGLKEGRFVQLRITKPTVSLERIDGRWNLLEFLTPLLDRVGADAQQEKGKQGETDESPFPLNRIQIDGLDLTVTLEDGATYSGFAFGRLDLTREDLESPWELSARQGSFRLNPSADEWPLFEAANLVRSLVGKGELGQASPTEKATGQPSLPLGLKRVSLDGIQVDLIHPGQSLSVGGLSFEAQDFFRFLHLQTGSLEKKSLKPSV